eukprot:463952-Prymnesium_polylepis.1
MLHLQKKLWDTARWSAVGAAECVSVGRVARTKARRAWPSLCFAARVGRTGGVGQGSTPVSYTHLTLPTICSV